MFGGFQRYAGVYSVACKDNDKVGECGIVGDVSKVVAVDRLVVVCV